MMAEHKKSRNSDQKCPVLDCANGTKSTPDIRFFGFPREKKKYGHTADIWSAFTRRLNFQPNSIEVMCEVHFDTEWFKTGNKRKQWWLKPGAVPTIYYRNGEKVVVPFDSQSQQYFGLEAAQLIQETQNFISHHEDDFVTKRHEKIKRLKNLCRFCFDSQENKTVALSELQNFSIDPQELLDLVGINSPVDLFSEIICDKCFKLIIEFESYRKRCQMTQKSCILELEELDKKIQEIRREKSMPGVKREEVWFKVKIENESHDCEEVTIENEIKQEIVSYDFEAGEDFEESSDDFEEPNEDFSSPKKKIYRKDPVKQKKYTSEYALRSFECFWCHDLLKGYSAFKNHRKICKREVRCEAVGCRKIFTNQGLFNSHISSRHGLEKVTRHFCSVCNVNYQTTPSKFEDHCRKCIEENKFKEQKIQCGICKETFNSLQAFTAHKVFHGSNLVQMMQPKRGPAADSKSKKPRVQTQKVNEVICDICGKIFGNSNKLRRHSLDVHLVDFKGDLYHCDLCPVAKPTRRLIYTHMKSTHIIKQHTCEVCGKIFKNRENWRKHILIHDESKRSNFCFLCPNQPGYVTKGALKKHMQKHHGGEQPERPFICEFCGAAYSLEHLVVRHKMKVHNI